MRHTRQLSLLLAALLSLGLSAVVGHMKPASAAPSTLVSWTATADSNAIDVVIDDTSGLGGAHPLDEIDVPEDASDFETGPFGHGLAAVVWPGQTGGNFGSLSAELPIPAALQPIAGQTNDPIRAETFYPGTARSTYPAGSPGTALEMTSNATSTGVSAKSGLADLSSALFAVKDLTGNSSATAESQAIATATADSGAVSILGGLITVGAISSTASASSDGTTATGRSDLALGTVAIAHIPIGVDSNGITGPLNIGGLGSVFGSANSELDSIISALNIHMQILPATQTVKGPTANYASGGLKISFSLPPSVAPSVTLPSGLPTSITGPLQQVTSLLGLLQGGTVTMTLGRAVATVSASTGFAAPFAASTVNPSGGGGITGSAPSSSALTASSPADQTGLSPDMSNGQGASVPATGNTPSLQSSGNQGAGTAPALLPLSYNKPTSTGLLVLGVLLALVASASLITTARRVPNETNSCPLESPGAPA